MSEAIGLTVKKMENQHGPTSLSRKIRKRVDAGQPRHNHHNHVTSSPISADLQDGGEQDRPELTSSSFKILADNLDQFYTESNARLACREAWFSSYDNNDTGYTFWPKSMLNVTLTDENRNQNQEPDCKVDLDEGRACHMGLDQGQVSPIHVRTPPYCPLKSLKERATSANNYDKCESKEDTLTRYKRLSSSMDDLTVETNVKKKENIVLPTCDDVPDALTHALKSELWSMMPQIIEDIIGKFVRSYGKSRDVGAAEKGKNSSAFNIVQRNDHAKLWKYDRPPKMLKLGKQLHSESSEQLVYDELDFEGSPVETLTKCGDGDSQSKPDILPITFPSCIGPPIMDKTSSESCQSYQLESRVTAVSDLFDSIIDLPAIREIKMEMHASPKSTSEMAEGQMKGVLPHFPGPSTKMVVPYFSASEGIVRYKRKKGAWNKNYLNIYYNAYLNKYSYQMKNGGDKKAYQTYASKVRKEARKMQKAKLGVSASYRHHVKEAGANKFLKKSHDITSLPYPNDSQQPNKVRKLEFSSRLQFDHEVNNCNAKTIPLPDAGELVLKTGELDHQSRKEVCYSTSNVDMNGDDERMDILGRDKMATEPSLSTKIFDWSRAATAYNDVMSGAVPSTRHTDRDYLAAYYKSMLYNMQRAAPPTNYYWTSYPNALNTYGGFTNPDIANCGSVEGGLQHPATLPHPKYSWQLCHPTPTSAIPLTPQSLYPGNGAANLYPSYWKGELSGSSLAHEKSLPRGSLIPSMGEKVKRAYVTKAAKNHCNFQDGVDKERKKLHPYHNSTMNGNGPNPAHHPPAAVRDSKAKLKEEIAELFNGNTEITRLTPIHLRKAKLMFFYTRYPNSNILKTYFPDIKFNRNNIAQLVKWFSNFREFFYIQMEKFARQALTDDVTDAQTLTVTEDSELYRTLIMHYNRNNHIQIPDHFRKVCESTLREFFSAICNYRDREPSWKKSIYKIIAQLDMTVPEYFKTNHFLKQLE